MKLRQFVDLLGQPYSEMLGIDIKSGRNIEILKWFLASILYGKPIRESTATDTYRMFEAEEILSCSAVLKTGWDGLVSILDEGGYTRYDFSTAQRLLDIFGNLQKHYGCDLNKLHSDAKDGADLEARLRLLGKGMGRTTISIFLREMRYVWEKAHPAPSPLVMLGMERLKIVNIEKFARRRRFDVVRLETALLRLGKDYIKKGKWPEGLKHSTPHIVKINSRLDHYRF
ncbi:MAG: hypothetical protein JRN15_14985 [Nitrososphaerota archaeon]|nr:hypothetical protein [Nitrososphaerota archaeon]